MKIKQILLSIITFVIPAILMTGTVFAGSNDSNITYQRIDNAYFYLQNNSTGAIDTNHVTKFYLNGQIAYCIEPMLDITTRVYNSTNDWSVTNLSNDQKNYIEMVGYFGYEYPSHNNDRYWLAAQTLIWEKVNPNVSVKFTTGENGSGNVIDLSREKNEILNLINNYKTLPSFANTTIEGNIESELSVTDTNGTLGNYNMSYNGKHQVTKDGNTLKIKFARNEITNETISFSRPNYDSKPTIIYYNGASQKLASLRISNPSNFIVNLKSRGADVKINKIGEKLVFENASYRYEVAKVPNTKFALYTNEDIVDSKGNIIYSKYSLVNTLTTDEDSLAVLNNLPLGKYFFVEVETAGGHKLDMEKYYFEITKDDIIDGRLVKTFDFNNVLPKGILEFTKTDLATSEPIPNTVIQIFTDEDRLIFTGTTDKDGKIVITDLPLNQKMYIIEKMPSTGYQITDEKIYFEIKSDGEIVKAHMTNEKEPKVEKPTDPEKQVVKVPNTGLDGIGFVDVIVLIFVVAGICYIIYVQRKK